MDSRSNWCFLGEKSEVISELLGGEEKEHAVLHAARFHGPDSRHMTLFVVVRYLLPSAASVTEAAMRFFDHT